MDSNWYAFCLAILKPVKVEEAFRLIGVQIPMTHKGMKISGTRRKSVEERDKLAIHILNLKEHDKLTWKEIGQMYGLTESGVRGKVRSYRKREEKKKVTQAPTKMLKVTNSNIQVKL